LKLFYTHASNSPLGLQVNDSRRIFNIQLLNKHYQTWPPELHGGGNYAMFKYSNTKSLKKEEDQGITLDPEKDAEQYDSSIIEIVQDIRRILNEIKNKKIPVAPAPVGTTQQKQVFFSKVAHTLIPLREQIIKELEANKVSVYKCELPPPYDINGHKREVTEKIEQSNLSVHLFDEMAGDKIANDYPYTFLQEQSLLGKALKKEQFIFIPQEMDFTSINDKDHGRFLSDLLTKK